MFLVPTGGEQICNKGYDVQSLAIVESMDASTGTVNFRK